MKISNLTSKTFFEINDTDILIIEDDVDTKKVTVKDLRDYFLNNGVTRSTKMLINEMMDNVINSLSAAKYVITELMTYKMNTVINDATSGNIYIALKEVNTNKWLTKEEINKLLLPNEDGIFTKNFIISAYVNDAYIRAISYVILDANEITDVVPEDNIGYIKAHFEGLTQNEIASITYDGIMISVESTEVTIVLPVEERRDYEFVGDPNLFNNHVPHIQSIG